MNVPAAIDPPTMERDYPDLVDRLDLELPQLRPVKEAVLAQDWPTVEKRVADHYRETIPKRFYNRFQPPDARPTEEQREQADRMLAHQFHVQGRQWYDLGAKIDWRFNPTSGEEFTWEITSGINRHGWFSPMALVYEETGDERYAREIVAQMIDWTRTWPRPVCASSWSNFHYPGETDEEYCDRFGWNTLQPADGVRGGWMPALARILRCPAIADREVCAVVWSLSEKAIFLDSLWPREGNKHAREQAAVYTVGAVCPEFKLADGWRRRAVTRLHLQLADEYYPDGMHNCLCVGYTRKMLASYLEVFDLARHNDRWNELPGDFVGLMEKMFNYQAYAAMPTGIIPGLSDSHDDPTVIDWGVSLFPQREDFRWFATDGREGKAPEQSSTAFPYCGHYLMRSGYDRDARYLLFDGGPLGSGHSHPDKLHLVACAYGKVLLVDAGNYNYDASRWRRYALSTRGHNTVTVNDLDQNDTFAVLPKPFEPLDNPWVSNDEVDFVRARYDAGYGAERAVQVAHTRSVVFVKPDYWVVVDEIIPRDGREHVYESLWHIDAEEAAARDGELVVTSSNRDDSPNLQLWPMTDADWSVEIVKGREEEPVHGWTCLPWRPVPTAVYRCRTD